MHHTCVFGASIANTGNVDVAAITDDVLSITNGHFLPQQDYDLLWHWIGSANHQRTRLATPTVRQITRPFFRPTELSLLPTDRPKIGDWRANPFRIRALEEWAIEASQGGAGAENYTAVFGLQAGYEPPPRGDVYALRLTSTSAAVARAWTTLATVTPDDTLPAGTYAIVGGEVQSATVIGWRVQLENQVPRPGGVGITLINAITDRVFLYDGLGVWGRFRSTRMPIWQVFCNAADASFSMFLHIVKVG